MEDLKLEDLDILSIGNTVQLVGAIWEGDGQMLLCMFPEHRGGLYDEPNAEFWFGDDENGYTSQVSIRTLSMNSDDWNKFLRQTDIMETEILAESADGKITKAIVRKSARQIAQTVCWEVYHRDGFKCRYCGAGPGIPLTVDHLVLWGKGGPNTKENLLTCCRRCNKTRGETPYAEWLESSYYKHVSRNLTSMTKEDNLDIVHTLDSIPRLIHKQGRRK